MVLPVKAGNVLASSMPVFVSASVVVAVKSKYHLAEEGNPGADREVACLSMVMVEARSCGRYRSFPAKLIFTSFPVPVFFEATRWVDGSSPAPFVVPAAAATDAPSTALPVKENSEDESSPETGAWVN